jgi:hypothetical protein
MKLKTTNMLCVACFIASLIIPSLVFSQQAAPATGPAVKEQPKQTTTGKRVHPREEYAPDQRPEEDYLARFKGIEVSEKLMQENLENIYILKVIVVNFKEQGWEKEYNDIYEEYKKAVAKYYRRQVIYSRLELERNKKNINNLFKKIVAIYQDQAYTMLDECADKILNFSLDERNKFDPNRSRVLFQNMMRLWIAYGQTDDSDASALDNQYKSAVYHLRISKAYAINILEDLSPEGSKREQFRVHKADNMNRVLTAETAKSTSPSPQTSPK